MKYTPAHVPNPDFYPEEFLDALEANFAAIEAAVENAAFRTGDTMEANLVLGTGTVGNGTVVEVVPGALTLDVTQPEPSGPIELEWTAPMAGSHELLVTTYDVFVSVNGASFVLLATVSGDTTSYSDDTAYGDQDGITYYIEAHTPRFDVLSNEDSWVFVVDEFWDDVVSLVQYHTGTAVDRIAGNILTHEYSGNGTSQQVQGGIAAGQGPFGGAAWFNPNSNTNGGVRNYMRVVAPAADASRFRFTGDVTMEGWFRLLSTSATGDKPLFNGLLEATDAGPQGSGVGRIQLLVVNGDTDNPFNLRANMYYRSGASWWYFTNTSVQTPTNLSPGSWMHVAYVRDTTSEANTRISIYLGGVRVATYTNSSSLDGTIGQLHPLFDNCSGYTVGSYILGGSPRDDLYAYWDQIRITKAARYTGASFTPPTAPFPGTLAP